jgi:hypothetical protein
MAKQATTTVHTNTATTSQPFPVSTLTYSLSSSIGSSTTTKHCSFVPFTVL